VTVCDRALRRHRGACDRGRLAAAELRAAGHLQRGGVLAAGPPPSSRSFPLPSRLPSGRVKVAAAAESGLPDRLPPAFSTHDSAGLVCCVVEEPVPGRPHSNCDGVAVTVVVRTVAQRLNIVRDEDEHPQVARYGHTQPGDIEVGSRRAHEFTARGVHGPDEARRARHRRRGRSDQVLGISPLTRSTLRVL